MCRSDIVWVLLAPLARKTPDFGKDRVNLKKQITVFHVFYNFARPHMTLREKISETDTPPVLPFMLKLGISFPNVGTEIPNILDMVLGAISAK